MEYPTQSELRRLFRYDKSTGELKKKELSTKARFKEFPVTPYRYIRIKNKIYKRSHLTWIFFNGAIPTNYLIDHINHNTGDDRIENLRIATRGQNNRNKTRYKNNTSGHVGITFYKDRNKWQAYIDDPKTKKTVNLGFFRSKSDALKARNAAENTYGYHLNHGK